MGFILTQPISSGSGSQVNSVSASGVISNNAILTIDNMDINISNTVKWFIELTDNINQKMVVFEIFANTRFNTITHNKTNIMGDNISYNSTVIINGNNINLNISNNESVNLSYKFVRINI